MFQISSADSARPSDQLRAERAVEAAADQQEGFVGDRLGAAIGDQEGDAAKRHQTAERDHERGHAEVGGEPALVHADHERHREAGKTRRNPVPAVRILEPGDEHTDGAHHRADREVDLARDDDQPDGGGDDADHGRLLRDVVEVFRRQEVAGGNLEGQRHHDQHPRHDRQAQVECADLKLVLQVTHGPSHS
jgi:hypothetical protein